MEARASAQLEKRAVAALTAEAVTAAALAQLIAETEAAIITADNTAEAARTAFYDPVASPDIHTARDAMESTQFAAARLHSLLPRLQEKARKVEAEEDRRANNANCDGCGSQWDNKQAAPVGSFPPNNFGLYDMVGNVWELVEDCWNNDYNGAPADGSAWISSGHCNWAVTRGGSFDLTANAIVDWARLWGPGFRGSAALGFRVARTLLEP